jgi:Cu/Ag efflux protein CusF
MKNIPGTWLVLTPTVTLALVISGCVSTTLQLAPNHPARIDAPSGRVESEPAAILRSNVGLYPPGEAENREIEQRDDPAPAGTREAPFEGQGVIQAVAGGQLQIQHGMIPGFMMAMTMTFPVGQEAMNDALEVGEEVVFKIERLPEGRFQIFSIEAVADNLDEASGPTR